MADYYIPLIPNKTYHVFSRAVGNEKLFVCRENYLFFLRQFSKYILPVADVFSYTLLPNHFHFMIKTKTVDVIHKKFLEIKPTKQFIPEKASDFIMDQFSNLLNSYTKSFNKRYSRKGALFIDRLRRVEILDDDQFKATLFYIHKNPVHHGYVSDLLAWPWSSYQAIIINTPTNILRNEILNLFGGIEKFLDFHSQPIYLKTARILE